MTDADLDALLAGETGAVSGLRPVADVLAALAAGPTAGELAGETRTLAEFRRRTGAPVPRQRARRGTAMLPSRLGAKIGAAATAVAIVLGGAATAAFANALPAPIQRLAHDAFGAPTPQPHRDLPGHGRPGAPGERAHGQAAARGGARRAGSRGAGGGPPAAATAAPRRRATRTRRASRATRTGTASTASRPVRGSKAMARETKATARGSRATVRKQATARAEERSGKAGQRAGR